MRMFLSAALLLFATNSQAGIFGPDNYEECVLDKMKGQAKSLIFIARKACEKKFPYEKNLGSYFNEYEFSWVPHNDNAIYFSIDKNYGEYRVTRARVIFSSNLCEDNTSLPDDHMKIVELSEKQDAIISDNSAKHYKCARVDNLWGIINP